METLAFNELIKYRNALRPWTIKTIEQCSNLFKVSNSDNIGMGETCSASALQTPVGTRCRFSVYETSIWRQGQLMDVIWTSHGRLMYVETTSHVYRNSRTTCDICSISVIEPIKDTENNVRNLFEVNKKKLKLCEICSRITRKTQEKLVKFVPVLAFNELIKYRNALRPWTTKTIEQCSNLFKVQICSRHWNNLPDWLKNTNEHCVKFVQR